MRAQEEEAYMEPKRRVAEEQDEGEMQEYDDDTEAHKQNSGAVPPVPKSSSQPKLPARVPQQPQKRGAPPTYTYPWPQGRTKDTGPPRFIRHLEYVEAAKQVDNETRSTYKAAVAAVYGVNFGTCLLLLPYWDVVRSFAMDVLHDIYLGPVADALEQTFGFANESESGLVRKTSHPLCLPQSVGNLISEVYMSLQPQIPTERGIRLKPPHTKHQYFKGVLVFIVLIF